MKNSLGIGARAKGAWRVHVRLNQQSDGGLSEELSKGEKSASAALLELARLGLLMRRAGFEVLQSRDGPRFFLNSGTRLLDITLLMVSHGIETVPPAGPVPVLATPHVNLPESRNDLANGSLANTPATSAQPSVVSVGLDGDARPTNAEASGGEELEPNIFLNDIMASLTGL